MAFWYKVAGILLECPDMLHSYSVQLMPHGKINLKTSECLRNAGPPLFHILATSIGAGIGAVGILAGGRGHPSLG